MEAKVRALLKTSLIAFLVLIFTPTPSSAYHVHELKPDEFKEAFEKAYFVGKAEVIKIDLKPELTDQEKEQLRSQNIASPTFITFHPLQSYKKDENGNFVVYVPGTAGFLKPGMIYEFMAFDGSITNSTLYGYYLPSKWKVSLLSPRCRCSREGVG